jgi:large subunit ribosomal protein L32e
MTNLLEVRKRIKAMKPGFVRQDAHRFGKLAKNWRKPRGRHSKMRLEKKGKPAIVNKGYRSPKSVRGMTKEGFVHITVFSKQDLERVDAKQVVIVGASVGKRKRVEIVDVAQQKGIKILNIKDAGSYKERVIKELEGRKKKRATRVTKKEKKEVKEKKEKLEEKKEKKTAEEANGKKEKSVDESQNEKEAQRRDAEKVIIQR